MSLSLGCFLRCFLAMIFSSFSLSFQTIKITIPHIRYCKHLQFHPPPLLPSPHSVVFVFVISFAFGGSKSSGLYGVISKTLFYDILHPRSGTTAPSNNHTSESVPQCHADYGQFLSSFFSFFLLHSFNESTVCVTGVLTFCVSLSLYLSVSLSLCLSVSLSLCLSVSLPLCLSVSLSLCLSVSLSLCLSASVARCCA
jgi:hypothetical protein